MATETGGIDFSSLELRHLAAPGEGEGDCLSYAFTAEPGSGDQPAGTGAARRQSDAFFV